MKDLAKYILLILILGLGIYNAFRQPKIEIKSVVAEVLEEKLKSIPRDSTIIERYHTIRTIRENRTVEFEQADSLKRDSLFWHYYLIWKENK